MEGVDKVAIVRREGLTLARVTQFMRILRLALPFFRRTPFKP